jgi:hypothetical protein
LPYLKTSYAFPFTAETRRFPKLPYPKRGKLAVFEKIFSQKLACRIFWQAF